MSFKPYPPEQVYDLLANVTCVIDVVMIAGYLADHQEAYSKLDRVLFAECILMIKKIF